MPANGSQKLIEIEDERRLRPFYEKRVSSTRRGPMCWGEETDTRDQMGQEVPADSIGDEWKGYIVRITGGNDKQGFPMKRRRSLV